MSAGWVTTSWALTSLRWGWDNHYADGAHNTTRRQLYTGFKSASLGELYFGQQNSVYYDVVGAKTDIWDYDMLARHRATASTVTTTDLTARARC